MATITSTELFQDTFTDGLRTGGEGAPWRLRPVDALPTGDGVARGGPDGLTVVPTASHPGTGEPAFTEPVPGPDGRPLHLRWGAFTTHGAPGEKPGFAAEPGRVLTVTAQLALRGFGAAALPDDGTADTDYERGAGGLISVDLETGMVFDFFLTHTRLYAVYERLAFAPGAAFASFTYAVPVAERAPGQVHSLRVGYDRAAGTVRWTADGSDVLTVDRIGHRVLDERYLRRDNGGREELVAPRRLSFGLGLFLDRYLGQGVRLSARRLAAQSFPSS